jgi:Asp-tRNA(Asn)/Glu-tRNA(Gln) amidotransferase A subunit family amidase
VSIPPFPWRDLYPREIDGAPVENYMAWLGLSASITVIGHPVTALPCGLDDQGTPFGLQVIGPAYDDRRLLSIARAFEQAFEASTVMRRPVPDLDYLANAQSECRTAGRRVH